MSLEDLVAEHGSPLWLANLEILRDRWRSFSSAWREEWPDVRLAYSYKANRLPAIVRALGAAGAHHQVASEAEYELARAVAGAHGEEIVVQGPAPSTRLLRRAGADGALVVADNAEGLRRAADAGVTRLGVRVSAHGIGMLPSPFGFAAAQVPGALQGIATRGLRVEALAMHLWGAGYSRRVPEAGEAAGPVARWPLPPEQFAASARTIASLAVRLRVPVVDVGGGFPPAPHERSYARTVTAAVGAAGFEGRLLVEPGRAIVGGAVDLVCRVIAVKRLADGTRCVIVDAGTDLVPGTASRRARIEALGATDRPLSHALVFGSLTTPWDVVHPAAELPALAAGDLLLMRRVGAYNQSQSSQLGDFRPAVVAFDDGRWQLCARREALADLLATDVQAAASAATSAPGVAALTGSAVSR
jgi:diaminopimelate decarboxylase